MSWQDGAVGVLEEFASHALQGLDAFAHTYELNVASWSKEPRDVDVSEQAVARARRAIDRAIAERRLERGGEYSSTNRADYWKAYYAKRREHIRERAIAKQHLTGRGFLNQPAGVRDAILRAVRDGARTMREIQSAVLTNPDVRREFPALNANQVRIRTSKCRLEGLLSHTGERMHYRYELTDKARALDAVTGRPPLRVVRKDSRRVSRGPAP